uniref:KRAB domain-containing protein n=1 Tax=Pseudonaja textilis TaxID=8673 RepID=A0A670YUJ7_PSETE
MTARKLQDGFGQSRTICIGWGLNYSPFEWFQALVSFEEVSMYFSEEEWRLLDESQRKIFTKVMMENYENVRELGESWTGLGKCNGLGE